MIRLVVAYVLDLLFGDPQSAPHPVRFIGALINTLEKVLYPYKNKRLSGILLVVLVTTIAYIAALSLSSLNIIIEIYLVYTVLATGALSFEAMKIYRLLENGDIEKAQIQLGFIVSRDTKNMSENDIIRSTVETVSENVVDGIISPLFFLFLGGVPLAMAYKAVSTMDSMIGYKTDKYLNFGWAAARLDDVLNFIPARITGFFLIPFASMLCGKNPARSFVTVVRDRKKHDSPNSAHAEAAVAGALGVHLGGRNVYFGKVSDKPFIGDKLKDFQTGDIKDTVRIMYVTSVAAIAIGIIVSIIINKTVYF